MTKRTRLEVATLILESEKKMDRLKSFTNYQIAQLLIEHVWSGYDVFSLKSDLIQEAIERLKGTP